MHFIRLEDEKGFTLIELVVVLLIIGLLASFLVLSGVTQASNAAKVKTCRANLRMIDTAIRVYESEGGVFPSSVGDLIMDGQLKTAPEEPDGGSYVLTAAHDEAICSQGHTY